MQRRFALLALALFGLFQLAGSCTGQGVSIVTPDAGATITTPSFPIQIELAPGTYDPASLRATLNGSPLTLAGGPTSFTAMLSPGAPLLDDCLLEVSVKTLSGAAQSVAQRFTYGPPKARVRRIADAADLITGPLAHSRVGDWLLANGEARFVIQDVAKRDLYSVGGFGGNLIDIERVGHPGLDNFLEMQPAVNVETVINAQTVEIVNDGQNGLPAVLRTCGPDDLLDFVNISSNIREFGFNVPAAVDDRDYEVDGCTEYSLAPGKSFLQLKTTLFNNEPQTQGYFVGDYVSASGELDQWTPPYGVGEMFTTTLSGLYFEGIGEARGVSYALVPIPVPGSPSPATTFLSTSGVTYVLQSANVLLAIAGGSGPTFTVPSGGSRSYVRYFGVGEGSGAAGVALEIEVRGRTNGTLSGCVTVGGAPRADVRVTVGTASGSAIGALRNHFVTDATGCYSGALQTGSYVLAAERRGSMYEGGSATPVLRAVTITAGQATVAPSIDLPAPGALHVTVVDETGTPMPARVSVVGFDPSPDPLVVVPVPPGLGLPDLVGGTFHDQTKDPYPFGIFTHVYAGANGVGDVEVEPGTYQVVVSRGGEYSIFSAPVTIASGATTNVSAQIARVIDTTGFISSDYHVHGIRSTDSRISETDRAMQFAGEGVDNIIMTDHHAHTDLTPKIASLGLTPFVHGTVGEEITTWDFGHFNAYPLKVDPTRPSLGSTDWALAAPPGRDFPAYGAFNLPPAGVAALAMTGYTSYPDTTIQINHISSHFSPLKIDSKLVPPRSVLTPAELATFRVDPSLGNVFHHFPALELWNGSGRSGQREFLNDRIGIWFNHLNQGLITTFIADTDTHEFFNTGAAGARTWTASSTDAPAAIDPSEVARSVTAGRAVGGQGLYVQTRLRAADGSNAVADLTLGGSTSVTSTNGAVELEIRVQAPLWAEYDRIEIFANAPTTVAATNGGVPVFYGATPALTFDLGAGGFTRSTLDVRPSIPGAQRFETTKTVSLTGLTQDTWFVVVVKGRDGVSRPMFPVFPHDLSQGSNTTVSALMDGNLNQSGTLALGATNALYADVDGTPGFNPPVTP
jgi:hypothetical protein